MPEQQTSRQPQQEQRSGMTLEQIRQTVSAVELTDPAPLRWVGEQRLMHGYCGRAGVAGHVATPVATGQTNVAPDPAFHAVTIDNRRALEARPAAGGPRRHKGRVLRIGPKPGEQELTQESAGAAQDVGPGAIAA